MGFEPSRPRSKVEEVNELVDRMRSADQEAQAALSKAKDDYARYYNRRHLPTPIFNTGDKVWLDSSDIRQKVSKKLAHLLWGPFEVERAVGSHAYRLKLPPWMSRVHPVFPVIKLEAAPPDPIPGRIPPPPPEPELIDDELEWEVEQVVDSKWYYGKLQFKVWYKGYPRHKATWQPSQDLENAPEKVAEFYRAHPQAVGYKEWLKLHPSPSIHMLSDSAFRELWSDLWYRRGMSDASPNWRSQRRDAAV